jgi:hypothetical protein
MAVMVRAVSAEIADVPVIWQVRKIDSGDSSS